MPRSPSTRSPSLLRALMAAASAAAATTVLAGPATSWAQQPEAGEYLVLEDFETPSLNWRSQEKETGSQSTFGDGTLRIRDQISDALLSVPLQREFADVIIEVDSTHVEGSARNWHVVYCRSGPDGYYEFGISSFGYWVINVWEEEVRLKTTEPTQTSAVRTGLGERNRMKVECVGDLLRLTVNGVVVGELRDRRRLSGILELGAATLGGDFTVIEFDNLIVRRP